MIIGRLNLTQVLTAAATGATSSMNEVNFKLQSSENKYTTMQKKENPRGYAGFLVCGFVETTLDIGVG